MGCPSPEPAPKGRATEAQPSLCIGRYEGTESLRGRRGYPQRCAAITTQVVTAPQDVCGAARCVGTCARKSRQNTRPTVDCARPWKAENNENNPLTGVVCLLTKGVLIRVGHRVGHWTSPSLRRPLSHPMVWSLTAALAGRGRGGTDPPSRCSTTPRQRAGWRRARRGSSVRGGCSCNSPSSRRH